MSEQSQVAKLQQAKYKLQEVIDEDRTNLDKMLLLMSEFPNNPNIKNLSIVRVYELQCSIERNEWLIMRIDNLIQSYIDNP